MDPMKKTLFLVSLICFGSVIFAQTGMDLSLGFQYGTARVFDKGETLREITEPGILLTFRGVPAAMGFFARIGLLFPSSVTEGSLSLTYSNYDYLLFLNGALGAAFKIPIEEQFSFFIDAGFSINNLFYGGSFKDTINASWTVKLENLGTSYSGGHIYENIKMTESYNDVSFGIMGNAAIRINFSRSVFLELGAAASFDFLRIRSYKFYADFTSGPQHWQDWALSDFPHDQLKIDEEGSPPKKKAKELILESDSSSSIFKQFTFIPSISIGFCF
jgi:hypothetical protein